MRDTVECPAAGCEFVGDSDNSVATHWGWKHDGKCPLTHVDLVCEQCGDEFTVPRAWHRKGTRRFCGRDCKDSAQVSRVWRECRNCGEEFWTHPAEIRKGGGVACSPKCAYESMGPRGGSQVVECLECGQEFREFNSRLDAGKGVYCSRDCRDEHFAEQTQSGLEIRFRDELDRRGVEYEEQKKIGPWYVDFYLPRHDLVVECDGDFWHSLPRMQARDAMRDGWMKKHGQDFVRLSESEINDDVSAAADRALT